MTTEEIQRVLLELPLWERQGLDSELELSGEDINSIIYIDRVNDCFYTKKNIYVQVSYRGEDWTICISRNPKELLSESKERVCPFCGCEDLEIKDEDTDYLHHGTGDIYIQFQAQCLQCEARGPWKDTEDEAIKAFTEVCT